MAINPKELQKFHDLWAPMIAALPAVINAAESANELVNHTAILRAELDKVVATTVTTRADADTYVSAAQARVAELEATRLSLDAEVKEHAKETRKLIAEAKAAADLKIEEHMARAAEAAQATARAEEYLRKQLQENDKSFLIQKGEHESIIADLEAKRVAAEKALDKLREKLG